MRWLAFFIAHLICVACTGDSEPHELHRRAHRGGRRLRSAMMPQRSPSPIAGSLSIALLLCVASASCAAECRTLTGQVSIGSSDDGSPTVSIAGNVLPSFETLESIKDVCVLTGSVDITPTNLDTIDLPQLTRVGGFLDITPAAIEGATTSLTRINLPLLESVGGDLTIFDHANLTRIDIPSLASVGGRIVLAKALALESIDMPLIADVGIDLRITDDAALTSVELPALTRVGLGPTPFGFAQGTLEVSRNPSLTALGLPLLEAVGAFGEGTLLVADGSLALSVSDNERLTRLDLPKMTTVAGNLNVTGNQSLTGITAPELNSVGAALFDGASPDISGNAELASCTGALIENIGDCVQ